jgi:autotransporter passenger strand-loop-strand repeat protein
MTTQFVSSGVVSSGVIVSSGNILEVLSGGTADVTSVTSGGLQQVDAGGFASGTVISARRVRLRLRLGHGRDGQWRRNRGRLLRGYGQLGHCVTSGGLQQVDAGGFARGP